jgi:hypothetical protein
MAEAQNRVLPNHPRPGIAHHGPDLIPPIPLIAVNRALGADRLLRPEPAALEPKRRIVHQLLALGAEASAPMMMTGTIAANHGGHGAVFPGQTLGNKASNTGIAPWARWLQVE